MLECVPNISEGRDRAVVGELADAVTRAGARLLDVHRDPDHHRAVLTAIGEADVIAHAALEVARVAVRRVDIRRHRGVHPRIGAVDVVPFVPLRGSTMADAVVTAHAVGGTMAAELSLPVFFYGAAARVPERRELPPLRTGGFEGLAARLADPRWIPDAGPTRPHPTAGAAIVGARGVLIAFNAVLTTGDLGVARRIAQALRESGGGLPAVRAIGVPLASRGLTQVSMNLLDYRRTPVSVAARRLEAEARRDHAEVLEYELVGCAPRDAFDDAHLTTRIAGLRRSQLLDPDLFAPGG